MPHPLVTQLHFTRSEWLRAFEGVTAEEATQRFEPINCLSWMMGHLASQENNYWVLSQGKNIAPALAKRVGGGQPASTPPYDEMLEIWHTVTKEADIFLNTLTTDDLLTHMQHNGQPMRESIGTMLHRNIYHYWFHLGESQAVRQLLGHKNLPSFVGNMSDALYAPD